MIKINQDLNISYCTSDSVYRLGMIDTSIWEELMNKVNKIDLRYLPERTARFDDCMQFGLILYDFQGEKNECKSSECVLSNEVRDFFEVLKMILKGVHLKDATTEEINNEFYPYHGDDQMNYMLNFNRTGPPPHEELPPPFAGFPVRAPIHKSKAEKATYESSLKKVKAFEDSILSVKGEK